MPMIQFFSVFGCESEYIEKDKPHKVVVRQQPPKERIYEEAEDCWFQLHIVVQAAWKWSLWSWTESILYRFSYFIELPLI